LDREIDFDVLKIFDQFKSCNNTELRYEFKRLLCIIESYNCAKINKYNYGPQVERNENTKLFKQDGGFKSIYQNERNKIKKDKIRKIYKKASIIIPIVIALLALCVEFYLAIYK